MVIFNSGGFEEGDLSGWTGNAVSAGCTIAADHTLPHHGLHSAKCNIIADAGTKNAYVYATVAAQTELYCRGYVYVDSHGLVDNDDRIYFIGFYNIATGAKLAGAGWYVTVGVLKWILLGRNAAAYTLTYGTTPVIQRWYCVELYWKKHGAAGIATLYVDGAQMCTVTGKDTDDYGDADRVRFGITEGIALNADSQVYADCCIINTALIGTEPLKSGQPNNTMTTMLNSKMLFSFCNRFPKVLPRRF